MSESVLRDGPPYGHLAQELLAGRWRRLFAGLADAVILGWLTGPLLARAGVFEPMDPAKDFADFVFHLDWRWLIAGAFVWYAYHWLLVGYWNGRTVGKKALGIRVVRENGARLSPAMAAGRALMTGFYAALGLTVIDLVWIMFTRRRHALHDLAANTVVMIG
ncbi:RDD family protein [Nonomuraea sp. CA-143628]|uniref:RDD family protein n=1 Tax=Nonomuraea sp. CA-143628 TaxID=3239997 RepID=UPI003D8AA888